jgi:hypothetical protein
MGPTLAESRALYDPHHLLDFTQASVRGQFYLPEHVLARVRPQAENARQAWLSFASGVSEARPEDVAQYLRAVEQAANAIAGLSGPPLTERRFLLEYPRRAEAVGSPGLSAGLLGLLGAPQVDPGVLGGWLDGWQTAIEALPAGSVPRLHPARIPYYRKAIEAMLRKDQPQAALWPLIRTWTDAARAAAVGSPAGEGWRQACEVLGLLGSGFNHRINALDAYLDTVEETLERWARDNGAS